MSSLNKTEIELMKSVCRLAAETLRYVGTFVVAGITTNELDRIVYDYTLNHGAIPSPLNYHGYPKSICTSINSMICHGVPDDQPLKEGDIINIDVTSFKDGFHGDTSAMFYVYNEPIYTNTTNTTNTNTTNSNNEDSNTNNHSSNNITSSSSSFVKAQRIIEVAKNAMMKGIEAVKPYGTTGDIGFAINKFVQKNGYHVVREIGGHGIGRKFHDSPFVPSFGKKSRGDILQPWTCITVEPMINETDAKMLEYDIPNSTIKYYKTGDNTMSAQFEHTVLITDTGYEILT